MTGSLTSSDVLESVEQVEERYRRELEELELDKPKKGKKKSVSDESKLAVEETTEEATIEAEDMEELISLSYGVAFVRMKWDNLSKRESKALSIAWSRVLNKYMPKFGNYKEIAGLVLCHAMIIGTRVKKNEEQLAEQNNGGIRTEGNRQNNLVNKGDGK